MPMAKMIERHFMMSAVDTFFPFAFDFERL